MDYRLPSALVALRWGVVAAIGLAVVVGAWSIYWLVLATGLRDGVLQWMDDRRAGGLEMGIEAYDIGGYPASVRLTLARPSAAAGNGGWSWSADRAELALDPFSPRRLRISAEGAQSVAFRTAEGRFAFDGTVGSLVATIAGNGGRPAGTLAVRDLRLADPGGGGTLAVARLDAEAAGDPSAETPAGEPSLTVAASLDDARLPAGLALPLGERVASAALEARLMGTLAAGPAAESLARWRDSGGTVEISRLDLGYGSLDLNANGTLALDGDAQPIGAFTTRIRGFFQAVDALRRQRLIGDRAAITAKLVLGALARRGSEGERPTLSIPLTLQDRLLYAGPVPLIEVPPVRW